MPEHGTGVKTEDELVIERVFDAPCELVWQAWTDPEHFVQWWGPAGFTTPHCTIDLRVGGRLLVCMSSQEYGDFWAAGVFNAVEPPSRLVYTSYMADEDGNKVPPTRYGIVEGFPDETVIDLRFEDLAGGRTKMTLRQAIPSTLAQQSGALEGWSQSFDKLAAYLVAAGRGQTHG
jgi:uncharacterized protein YndB with AHSA1/START domain